MTEKSRMTLTCATDHALETTCPHAYKAVHTEDFGQVAFTIEAQPGCPIHHQIHGSSYVADGFA